MLQLQKALKIQKNIPETFSLHVLNDGVSGVLPLIFF
jgi:hypothetical protein